MAFHSNLDGPVGPVQQHKLRPVSRSVTFTRLDLSSEWGETDDRAFSTWFVSPWGRLTGRAIAVVRAVYRERPKPCRRTGASWANSDRYVACKAVQLAVRALNAQGAAPAHWLKGGVDAEYRLKLLSVSSLIATSERQLTLLRMRSLLPDALKTRQDRASRGIAGRNARSHFKGKLPAVEQLEKRKLLLLKTGTTDREVAKKIADSYGVSPDAVRKALRKNIKN